MELGMEIMPTSLDLEVIGCPYVAVGQQYFVDLGTNTTADNFYGVFEVNHSFEGGSFKTSLRLGTMGTFGRWRSTEQRMKSMVAAAADAANKKT